MDNKLSFSGTGVALVTPFAASSASDRFGGRVDFAALGRLVKYVTQPGGVDYLVLFGTTAESVNLSIQEKIEIINFVIAAKPQAMPIVLGVGGNNLLSLENDLSQLPLSLVQALMLVTPYYNKPSQEALYAYYNYVHSNTQHPILIYNVPGRTGVSIKPATVLALACDCERIIGIKEASSDIYHCLELCAKLRDSLCIIAGNDGLIPALCALGMQGVISVCANAYPKFIAQIVNKSRSAVASLSSEELVCLYELDNLCFMENNPAGIKYILSELSLCANVLRLPLTELSAAVQAKIRDWMQRVKLDLGNI